MKLSFVYTCWRIRPKRIQSRVYQMSTPQDMTDARIIEYIRFSHAVLREFDPAGAASGELPLRVAQMLVSNPSIHANLSPALANKLIQVITDAERALSSTNKNTYVDEIYFFPGPVGEYPPWQALTTIPVDHVSVIAKDILTVPWNVVRKPNGTILVSCSASNETKALIIKTLCTLAGHGVVPIKPDTPDLHVTIECNVEPTAEMTAANIAVWMYSAGPITDIQITGVSKTVSIQWEKFAECYVIHVESEQLRTLVDDYNILFNRSAAPSFHITFGGIPRVLVMPGM